MVKTFPSFAASVLLCAAGACAAAGGAISGDKPSADAARPEFAAILNAAQDLLLKQGKAPDALARLKEAEALPNLSPYEQYLLLRVRAPAEYAAGDYAHGASDFEQLLDDSRLPAADRPTMTRVLIDLLAQDKQYAQAAQRLARYFEAGGNDPRLRELQAQVLYLEPDYPAAAKALQALVDAEAAAGQVPGERHLRLLLSAQSQAKDEAGRDRTLERLAVAYPKPDVWREITSRAAAAAKFSDREVVDVYRLQAAAPSGLPDAERLSYAALAARAGYPAEARRVLEEGKARNAFAGADAAEAAKLLAGATKSAAADRASAPAAEASARSARDGNALASQGLLYAVDGDPQRGAVLLQQALDKGGLKSPDEARLHLGYAQYLAGDAAGALKSFQGVAPAGGPGALAHAWTLLAQSKLQPHPAAAAAAAAD
jgi:hypothetical protein